MKHVLLTRDELMSLKRQHIVCEDCWYSCPASGECCNDAAGDECNCGATKHNARIDELLKKAR